MAPYDCVLAVDMVYALNALEPEAIQTLGGLDPERTIYIDSFSKKFGLPGLRLGFAICTNLELIEALRMMKAAESVSASNVKLLFAAHLLQQHMALAETTATEIRRRYYAFREAIAEIEEYGVEVPPLTGNANAFYLPLFLDRLLERTGLSADAFVTLCYERYQLEVVPGTRMYPPAGAARRHARVCRMAQHISARLVRWCMRRILPPKNGPSCGSPLVSNTASSKRPHACVRPVPRSLCRRERYALSPPRPGC